MTETAVRDRWLFLTPEAEVELPAAVAALAAALGEPGRAAGDEEARLEAIILDGGYREWLAYLRERRTLLERYVERLGGDALAAHVADVLMNHWLLALTVPGQEAEAEVERRRLDRLVRRLEEQRRGPA
ncbi:MAG TPA: hypothetical protein VE777_10725 [Gaiellales bacterium]|jgi:hypothetical protein|nr:hypothetical protein [Gaiellales bacterium]